MRPLLTFGADGQEKNISAAIDALANEFHLTSEDRTLLLPSGGTVLANRVLGPGPTLIRLVHLSEPDALILL